MGSFIHPLRDKPHTFKELVAWARDIKLGIKTNASENMFTEEIKDDITGGKSITDENEKSMTLNFSILIFKPRHFIRLFSFK